MGEHLRGLATTVFFMACALLCLFAAVLARHRAASAAKRSGVVLGGSLAVLGLAAGIVLMIAMTGTR